MSIYEQYLALQAKKTTALSLLNEAVERYHKTQEKNPIGVLSLWAENQALKADHERKKGFYRGFLQGIPCVIKDNIMYADGTPTTANSYALKDFIPQHHAPIVERLLSAGAVIMGKANLSEFAYFMGDKKMPSGYGSMYGQVKHPTDETIDPYGSSTGSAVAVALGIVPFAIGTETNGSLMAPAHQCQIVALKPTHGIVSTEGIIPISPTQDTAGPMAKTVFDCAAVMDVLVDDLQKPKPGFSYVDALKSMKKKPRIGILELTNYPYSEMEKKHLEAVKSRMNALGWDIQSFSIKYPPLENFETLKREFKVSLNDFLSQHAGEGAPKDLAAIIAFNEANQERCLRYGQKTLLDSQEKPDQLDVEFFRLKNELMQEASQLDTLLYTHQLDAMVTLGWLSFAPIFGNPSLCTPEGWLEGQPKGLVWVGKKHDDGTLLQLGHAYYDQSKLSS